MARGFQDAARVKRKNAPTRSRGRAGSTRLRSADAADLRRVERSIAGRSCWVRVAPRIVRRLLPVLHRPLEVSALLEMHGELPGDFDRACPVGPLESSADSE